MDNSNKNNNGYILLKDNLTINNMNILPRQLTQHPHIQTHSHSIPGLDNEMPDRNNINNNNNLINTRKRMFSKF